MAIDPRKREWRVGGHWGVTIVAIGELEPDENGSRADDDLIGMALDRRWAEHIVNDHNAWLPHADVDEEIVTA